MIMKANKQIGFIYKNNESIDKILKDGDVVFERGFLREKTSTTLPITFGGVGKDLKDYKIYGNTYQNSTRGVNLFNHYLYPANTTYNGITITNNGDGSFTLNGTCTTNNSSFALGSDAKIKELANEGQLTQTAYYISGTCTKGSSSNARTTIRLNYDTGYTRMIPLQNLSTQSIISKTHPQDSRETGWSWRIVLDAGDTFDNFTIKYQLEKGSEATEYEPYTNGPAPNPEFPIDMVSCGDKSKNLYNPKDINTFTYSGITLTRNIDGSYTIDGTSTSSTSATRDFTLSNPITLKSGESVTFSKDNTLNKNLGGLAFRGNNETLFILYTNTLSYTYTATSDITIDTIRTFYIANSTYDNYTFKLFIARGSNPTNEPYYEGYKIPVNVRSENLFDKDNANILNAAFSDNGKKVSSSQNGRTLYIKCKPNTTYTVTKKARERFRLLTTETLPSIDVVGNNYQFGDTNSVLTIETTSNDNYLCVYYYLYGTDTLTEQQILDSIMIVEGSTAPSKYIPYYNETTNIYLDEPLRKTKDGTYVDYIDFRNQKVYRQLGETEISNYSSFAVNAVTSSDFVQYLTPAIENLKLNIRDTAIFTNNLFFCNYNNRFGGTTASSKIRINILHKYLGTTSSSTSAEAKQALINLMNGKTMEFVYPLETPTEEDIELPNIPTLDGNNTLNIETEITPSQVYIKYKSNE